MKFSSRMLSAALLLLLPMLAVSQTKTITLKGNNTDPGDVIEVDANAEVDITVNADGIVLTMPGIDLRTKCLGDITADGYCFIAAAGLPANTTDLDMDGVPDINDVCPSTAFGALTDRQGCSVAQQDDDGDGIPNGNDVCDNTPANEIGLIDASGCGPSESDGDNDGVDNATDQCPNTPAGQSVNNVGCALSELDSDSDGVSDAVDQCANTAAGATVDANGCSEDQLGNTASYCVGTPGDVSCSQLVTFDPFVANVGERSYQIPANSTLAFPFTLPASTTNVGLLQLTTADDLPYGYSMRVWYSTTPGGTPLPGAGCNTFGDARGNRYWSQDTSQTGGVIAPYCQLGTAERVLYANFKAECNISNACNVGSALNRSFFFDVARNNSI